MQQYNSITKEDAIFYLDMIDSTHSPNVIPKYFKRKPVEKLVKNKDSDEYKRFIRIYQEVRHTLLEREQYILDKFYGIGQPNANLKTIGEEIGISGERVRQIKAKAERKLSRVLYNIHYGFKKD